MTTSRDAIISKLRKLSSMTTANGCSEAEAQAAAAVIARLMAEHAISQNEYSIRAEAASCTQDFFLDVCSELADWTLVCKPIAKLFGTKAWASAKTEDLLEIGLPITYHQITYFGLPADVAASLAMTTIISMAINTESTSWRKTHRGKAQDFRMGMIDRFIERLAGLTPPPVPSSGTSLIVLKDQLVTEEYAKLNMRLRANNRRFTTPNTPAYAQGRAAADRSDLGRGQRLAQGPKLIGQG